MRRLLLTLTISSFALSTLAAQPLDPLSPEVGDRVPLAAAAFERDHRDWEKIATGVYQRINSATGAIGTASIGPLGYRHDLAQLNYRIAVAEGELDALSVKDLKQRAALEAQLNALREELRLMHLPTAKNVSVFYQSPSCEFYYGTFRADFSKTALSGGANRGTVLADAQIGCESPSWCPPPSQLNDWVGGARSKAVAKNGSGTLSDIDATAIMPVTSLAISSSVSTPFSSDPNCTLTASASINTTEYQGCWIYFNRSETRYCSQIPY